VPLGPDVSGLEADSGEGCENFLATRSEQEVSIDEAERQWTDRIGGIGIDAGRLLT